MDLYIQLNLSSVHDSAYSPDLHYEWVGGDTIIVLVGDLIDGSRESSSVKKNNRSIEEVCYYPQVEIKLLKFINALNKQAKKYNGGILKVLGNHDYENFKGNEEFMESYTFITDRHNPYYYQHKDGTWESRETFFQFGHEGYRLYQETLGMYFMLCINQTIFVHGQLPSKEWLDKGVTLEFIEHFQKLLKMPFTESVREQLEQVDDIIETILWNRSYGDLEERDGVNETEFIESVKHDIAQFCGTVCGPNPENSVRVLIGHCQQHLVHQQPDVRSSLGHLCHRSSTKEVYDNVTMYRGLPDGTCVTENKTFGIVTEGLHPKLNNLFQPLLIKLDVGMGRGQEYIEDYRALQRGELLETDYFRPRAPQVFEIEGPELRIHRSTMKNVGIHMKRDSYKALHKSYPSIYA
jgi:hypothetical protein